MPDIFNSSKHENIKIGKKHGDIDKNLKIISKKDYHQLPGHTHNPLASYSHFPDFVRFINEDPEEKVVLLLRKHPATNLSWISIAFLMIIAPAFVSVLTPFYLLPGDFQLVLVLVWYLLTSAFILEEFLSWFFHVNIVTDERIIEVDFANLIYREITDANIDQIQDVTVEVGGALRTFLHFGNVLIQTAAEVPKIEFEAVPNPDLVTRILRELRLEEEKEKLEGRIR
jgi:membrane protein YdbS with pleckstrin-like domain